MTSRLAPARLPAQGPHFRAPILPWVVLVAVVTLWSTTSMNDGGDTWIGLACGRHIVTHGVNDVDPFSFTSRPSSVTALPVDASSWQRLTAHLEPKGWINQNWLTHLLLFGWVSAWGEPSLGILKLAVYAALAALLWATLKLQGRGSVATALSVVAALSTARGFAGIRPQDLTNLLTAGVLLLLSLAGRRSDRMLWLAVPLMALWCNLHGGFIYGIVLLACVATARAWCCWHGGTAGLRRLAPAVALLIASTLVCVVASPYLLSNLTHPLVVTVSADASLWREVAEWRPAWDLASSRGKSVAIFVYLGLLCLAGSLSWIGRDRGVTGRESIDPACFVIAAVTTVLALGSWRFIPIAAVGATPLLALWLEGALNRISAKIPVGMWVWAPVAAIVLLVPWWAFRFHAAYLVDDGRPISSYARLTERWRHGEDICRFLADNHFTGRVFNTWSDGALLAWCQTPDPATGRLPFELFIDGRAQAAYPTSSALRWRGLRAANLGGRVRSLSRQDMATAASWLDHELRKDQISALLLAEWDGSIGINLVAPSMATWRISFMGRSHMLVVDVASDSGRELYDAVLEDRARYPDESTRLFTRAMVALREGWPPDQVLADLVAAYRLRPAAAIVRTADILRPFPQLRPSLDAFLTEVSSGCRPSATAVEQCRAASVANTIRVRLASEQGDTAAAARVELLALDERRTADRASRFASW